MIVTILTIKPCINIGGI